MNNGQTVYTDIEDINRITEYYYSHKPEVTVEITEKKFNMLRDIYIRNMRTISHEGLKVVHIREPNIYKNSAFKDIRVRCEMLEGVSISGRLIINPFDRKFNKNNEIVGYVIWELGNLREDVDLPPIFSRYENIVAPIIVSTQKNRKCLLRTDQLFTISKDETKNNRFCQNITLGAFDEDCVNTMSVSQYHILAVCDMFILSHESRKHWDVEIVDQSDENEFMIYKSITGDVMSSEAFGDVRHNIFLKSQNNKLMSKGFRKCLEQIAHDMKETITKEKATEYSIKRLSEKIKASLVLEFPALQDVDMNDEEAIIKIIREEEDKRLKEEKSQSENKPIDVDINTDSMDGDFFARFQKKLDQQ